MLVAKKIRAKTQNSGWSDPSKKKKIRKPRKPMTDDQKQADLLRHAAKADASGWRRCAKGDGRVEGQGGYKRYHEGHGEQC